MATLVAFLAAPGAAAAQAPELVDRAAEVGIDFVHFNGMTGELYFAEMMGAGAALADVDGDGDLDAFVVQGSFLGDGETLADAVLPPRHPPPFSHRLYLNGLYGPDGARGELAFTDATAGAGLEVAGYGMGVATGDYDNDGDVDLYVAALGANQLLANDGSGRFTDVTAAAGAADPRWSVVAVFLDFDADGWLDLYVGNYVDFRVATHKTCTSPSGARDYCSPSSFEPQSDRLLRNLGPDAEGVVRFADVTAAAGIDAPGPTLGAVAADFDGDGRIDLYVANDGAPNFLWSNQGDGRFADAALLAGCAVNEEGQPEASMGVMAEDFDGDGSFDLFMTHLARETNTLYLNDGSGMFSDASAESGLGAASWRSTGFGTALVDFDGDSHRDLFVANGAVLLIEEQHRAGHRHPLAQPNDLYRGGVGGGFTLVEGWDGGGAPLGASRGVAAGDVDDDGDLDLLVVDNGGPASLLLDESPPARRWAGLRLLTGDGRRDALGAVVALHLGDGRVTHRMARTDGSYASASDPRALFTGLEDAGVTGAVVRWPDGSRERFDSIELGRYQELRQGRGESVP